MIYKRINYYEPYRVFQRIFTMLSYDVFTQTKTRGFKAVPVPFKTFNDARQRRCMGKNETKG
ncbi:MAG: hypothetical protein LBP79_06805 [Clostridiales bacterium]|nr:hypothetical protein [Clostridiales bacterium]